MSFHIKMESVLFWTKERLNGKIQSLPTQEDQCNSVCFMEQKESSLAGLI